MSRAYAYKTQTAHRLKGKRRRLANKNRSLVYHLADRFAGRGVTREELVSAGFVGLCIAAAKYDKSLGFKFVTYAGGWIRHCFIAEVESRRMIHVPVNKARSEAINAEHERMRSIRVHSMSALVEEGDLPYDPADQCEEATYLDRWDDGQIDGMRRAMDALCPRHRRVLELRLTGLAYAAIGAELGVCGERARGIARDAIRRMRKFLGVDDHGKDGRCVSMIS